MGGFIKIMEYFYCRTWFRAKKQPIDLLSREEAETLHSARKQYTVLLKSAEKPDAFIEINNDFVGVSFLNEDLSEYLTYQFQEKAKNKLFLSMATHREFNDNGKIVKGTTYYFKENGIVKLEKEDFLKEHLDEASSQYDSKKNWEDYPVFGDYSNLCVKER